MSYGNYPDLSQINKILVVKMRHHGDVLLTSPVFSVLKQALPHALIDAYIYDDTLPMLEGLPSISSFILYERQWKNLPFFKKIKKEFSLLLSLRKKKYDLVINLTEGDRGALASLLCKSKYRVGFDPKGKGLLGKKKLYTHIVKQVDKPRHTVEKQLDALRCIGIFPQPVERDLSWHIPPSALLPVEKKLRERELENTPFVVIHAVSRWRFKCPPPEFMAKLILELRSLDKEVVLSSSPDPKEREMLEEILSHIPTLRVHNLGGQTTLKELGALLLKAECLITVDSVPLHMASALKTPVVTLFGPTSELTWGPWMHPQSVVLTKNISCRPCFKDGCGGSKMSDCLYTLNPADVVDAVKSLIETEATLILS